MLVGVGLDVGFVHDWHLQTLAHNLGSGVSGLWDPVSGINLVASSPESRSSLPVGSSLGRVFHQHQVLDLLGAGLAILSELSADIGRCTEVNRGRQAIKWIKGAQPTAGLKDRLQRSRVGLGLRRADGPAVRWSSGYQRENLPSLMGLPGRGGRGSGDRTFHKRAHFGANGTAGLRLSANTDHRILHVNGFRCGYLRTRIPGISQRDMFDAFYSSTSIKICQGGNFWLILDKWKKELWIMPACW